MSQANVPVKSAGDPFTATECNSIVTAVNSKQDIEPFSALSTSAWDFTTGKKKTYTLTANTDIILSNVGLTDEAMLQVTQAGGPWSLSINGDNVDVNATDYTLIGVMNVSGDIRVISGAALERLATPSLTATVDSDTQITLSWGAVTNATNYVLDSSLDNSVWTQIFIGSGLSHTDTGLIASTHYFYRLTAEAVGFKKSYYGLVDAETDGAAPADTPITFPTVVGLTESPTGIWSGTTGGAGTYLNKGLSDLKLAAGTNGYIQFLFDGSINENAIIGFNTSNSNDGYSGYEAGVFVTGGALAKVDSGSVSMAGGPITSGHYVRIERAGATIKMRTSPDNTSWTDVHTYTFSSAADLFIGVNVDSTNKMNHPAGGGLI